MAGYLRGRDAAFASNIGAVGPGAAVLGYIGGPAAYHVWPADDWATYPRNPKIPIWVAGSGGTGEGWEALRALWDLGVPTGKVVILDMEAREDRTYVQAFGDVLQWAGFKVWVYGSSGTIFANPQLNGYAVADPTGTEHMFSHPGVRMTQWAFGPKFDDDAIKEWLLSDGDFWV